MHQMHLELSLEMRTRKEREQINFVRVEKKIGKCEKTLTSPSLDTSMLLKAEFEKFAFFDMIDVSCETS